MAERRARKSLKMSSTERSAVMRELRPEAASAVAAAAAAARPNSSPGSGHRRAGEAVGWRRGGCRLKWPLAKCEMEGRGRRENVTDIVDG